MKVSVIIPTYNAEQYLPNLLTALLSQTIKFEILIIDSSSTDKTVDIAQSNNVRIKVIPKSEFDHGGTRTQAAKMVNADIVVFLTQDALPKDDCCIEQLVKVFKNERIGAAYGRQTPYTDTHIYGSHLRMFNYPEKSYLRSYKDKEKYGIKTAFLSDSFAAYRRDSLQKIGWFKNGLINSEDLYAGALLLKQGFQLAYVSEAKVIHSHGYTLKQEFSRYFDIGIFHQCEPWITKELGNVSGEGKKYVVSELIYIAERKKYFSLFVSIVRNATKYLGFFLGKKYRYLPKYILYKLILNQSWCLNNPESET
jgi:rhamnosyltransferase